MKIPDGNKEPIKPINIPKDVNLQEYITLEEENKELKRLLEVQRKRVQTLEDIISVKSWDDYPDRMGS